MCSDLAAIADTPRYPRTVLPARACAILRSVGFTAHYDVNNGQIRVTCNNTKAADYAATLLANYGWREVNRTTTEELAHAS